MSDDKQQGLVPVAIGERGIALRGIDELIRFAQWVSKSQTRWTNPADVVVAVQTGMELGFSPMQSLNNIPIVEGRPTILVAAARAIVQSRGVLEPGTFLSVSLQGEGDNRSALAISHRRGMRAPFPATSFSLREARKAGLVKERSGWEKYPDRMLQARALGWHLRDYYSDVLLGLYVFEEIAHVSTPDELPARPATTQPPELADPLLAQRQGDKE